MCDLENTVSTRQRGMTLVETLFAFLILMIGSVAVLELVALSVAVNLSSAVRSDVSQRAQQTCEAFRTIISLNKTKVPPTMLASCGVTYPIAATTEKTLTTDVTNVCWGKSGFNVLDEQKRYKLSYSICDGELTTCVTGEQPGKYWVVTINVKPQYSAAKYNLAQRVVTYVAQIAK
jgi:Tfp pilus assembly protein PilV